MQEGREWAPGWWWYVLSAASLSAFPLAAQTTQEGLRAHRITSAEAAGIVVDGALSEDMWRAALPASGFRQREPLEGEPASERTEVHVVYDDETLYIGVMAYDNEPDEVVARILQRDKLMEPEFFGGGLTFGGDDAVAILLDPFHDHRSGVVFATNPNGAEFEALLSDEGSDVNIDWRGVWEVAGTRTPEGWSAEFAIPWRTLRYPAAPTHEWGLNVFRIIRRKNEEALWQSWRREGGGFHRVSGAGHLTGLENLPAPGLNLETKPFILVGGEQEREDGGPLEASRTLEAGFDLKAELRPGLVLDLTYNTDFAQVEVDDAQVNLTRFDLFFPEKRDFFLENAGIFQFGVPGNPFEPPPFQLFFSRQIGIDEDEGVVPIIGGARLTGRVGGQTVGLLNMVTDEAYEMARENFSVFRVKRDVGQSNYLGVMATDRRGGGEWNTAAGVDGQFILGGAWVVDGYYARTYTGGPGGDDHSYRVGLDYTGDEYGLFLNHISVGAEAEAKSGFIVREDVRRTDLFARRRWRPPVAGLRKIDFWGGASYVSTMDGRLQDYSYGGFMNPEWESGETFNVFLNVGETVLDEEFELTDSVIVPPGRYNANSVLFFGNTAKNRWIYLDVIGTVSRFYDGDLFSLGGTLTMAPTPQVSLGVGYTRNDVEVPDGSFTADISALKASYSFSTKLTTNVLVQYNSLDRDFTTNVRLNFIHRPGSDLFLVFTENRGDDLRLRNVQDRGLVMKITYLARL